ncbi:MAG: glycosyltransferase, partial [Sciscionella sp.]
QAPVKPRAITQRLLVARRAVELLLGRSRSAIGALAADEAFWWHVSRFDTAVVTDASQEAVRVRTRDRARMLALLKQGLSVTNRLLREIPAVRQQYRDAVPELTSRDNWTRLYCEDNATG